MAKVAKKTKPMWGWNIHPGEILREEYMKPLGLSVYALAKELKLTRPRLNDIVLERRAITADTAIRLARYFGTTAQLVLQHTFTPSATESARANDAMRRLPRRWTCRCDRKYMDWEFCICPSCPG